MIYCFVLRSPAGDTFVTIKIPTCRLGEKEDRQNTSCSALMKANKSMMEKKKCCRVWVAQYGLRFTLGLTVNQVCAYELSLDGATTTNDNACLSHVNHIYTRLLGCF